MNSADLSQVIAAAGDAMAAEGVSRQVCERVANRLVWGHPHGHRTCPVHGTGMVYWPAGDDWACADASYPYGHGWTEAAGEAAGRMLAAMLGPAASDGPPWTHQLQLPDGEEAMAAAPAPAHTVTGVPGQLVVRHARLTGDRVLIERADPEILVSVHLAARWTEGHVPRPVLFDALLRTFTVRGVNRTVTYRLGDLEPDGQAYRAHLVTTTEPGPWPPART